MTLCKMQPEIEGMKPQFHPHPHHPVSLPSPPPPPPPPRRHHHHHHPLPHFHLPLFLHCPCSCPPLLLIPHHHHHHHQTGCPLPFYPRSSNLSCPKFSQVPPVVPSSQPIQNPCPIPSTPAGVESLEVSEAQTMDSSARGLQQQEWRGDQELEDEEEDVFVLTDEWREFFAKSEAKRRLAKQRKKKGGK
ncbi:uncharacterized histidine-rich protein DDB_G0274557-like [Phoenix dactylifera]|uniref:Uncharacterized histidine-rich protein DDB_G0274557-like n=1 Tax=Phoenix dactylifera TaxID=42345 RepID=A0A8B7C9I9_PHODC|nr:uncharacterized histidine-rich protein DDB_G0274557-like [Phoenix dactylifera]